MQEQFVTYEIALSLKELGFDEECFGYYSEQYDKTKILCLYQEEDYFDEIRLEAPLWQQAVTFFRDTYDIWIFIESDYTKAYETYNDCLEAKILYWCNKQLNELNNPYESDNFFDL